MSVEKPWTHANVYHVIWKFNKWDNANIMYTKNPKHIYIHIILEIFIYIKKSKYI